MTQKKEKLWFRYGQVRELALSKTARNSAIMFTGNFANNFLSLIAIIFVARKLGPADFGILGVFNALMLTLIGLTDFGLGTAAIKLISEQLTYDKPRANATMRVLVKLEFGTGLIIALVGLFFSKHIANSLGGPHLLMAVRLAFLAGTFGTMGAFFGPFFTAYQQFIKNAAVNLSGAVIRTTGVLILFVCMALNLHAIIILYAMVPVLFFFIGLLFVPKDFLKPTSAKLQKTSFLQIFHFSKWVFLSYIAASISGKLDTFLLLRYRGNTDVGLYTAAQQLVTVMPILVAAITTVLLPKASQLKTKLEYTSYLKKVVFGSILLALGLLFVLPFGNILIQLVFGHRFVGSLGAFRILFVGYLFALITNPLGILLYSFNKPQILTLLNYLQLVFAVLADFLLITRFGMIGAAITFMAVNIIGCVGTYAFVLRHIKRLETP